MKKNHHSKIKFYFLNYDLAEKHTGVERSSLLRGELFKEELGIEVNYITYRYRSHLKTEIENMSKNGFHINYSSVINIHDAIQCFSSLDYQNKDLFFYNNEIKISLNGSENNRFFYKNKKIKVMSIYNKNNNRLHYINHYESNGKRWKMDFYHESGLISCSRFLIDNQTSQELFYRHDGTICIIKNYTYKEQKRSGITIQVISSEGSLLAFFDNELDFITYGLDKIIKNSDENVLITDKNRYFHQPSLNLKKEHIKIIAIIHNLHLNKRNKINYNYQSIFDDLTLSDAIITQTTVQRDEIIEGFNTKENVYAIPHSYDLKNKNTSPVVIDKNKVVYFARYSKDKGHDLAIEAFSLVVKRMPTAELHCYGSGSLLADLVNKVKTMGMEKNIFLHGWCNNIEQEYNSAALSILSSESESFSLVVAESLAHGCPVVAFDVPYGPRELIESGVNGYLVSYPNTEAMSERIVEVLENAALRAQLSNNAIQSSKKYSKSEVANKWRELFLNLTKPSRTPPPL